MAKGYWIVRVDIRDMEKYKTYIAANAGPFKKYGANFLVRGGKYETPVGHSRARNAVIAFPSFVRRKPLNTLSTLAMAAHHVCGVPYGLRRHG